MKLLLIFSVLLQTGVALADFQLEKSKITYHVRHPLHKVEGVSEKAKGKGVCAKTGCEFLIAAPVKSFDSGNSNRDAHAWEVARAEQYPLVSVSVKTPQQPSVGTRKYDLTISMAGKTQTVPAELSLTEKDGKLNLTGAFDVNFSQFEMKRPSLLGVSVDDAIHIVIDEYWSR